MVILDLTRIVNKKINFNIRLIDTKESIIKRLVYGLRKIQPLLPKYIDIIDFNFDTEEMEVIDLFSIVREKYTNIDSFTRFYKDVKDWQIDPIELFKIWVISNREEINKIDKQFRIILLKYINDNALKIDNNQFISLINDIPNFQKELNEKIQILTEKIKHEFTFSSSFEKLGNMNYTTFQEDKRKISIEISNNFSSVLDLFDISKLNEYVPYLHVIHINNNETNEYSKISKTFNFLTEFKVEQHDMSQLNFYLYNLDELKSELLEKMYSPIDILHDGTKFMIELVVYTDKLNLTETKNRIQNIFTQTILFSNERNIYIGGIFYIPNMYFDKYILADLCLSDEMFQQFLKIDESLHAYRKKSSVYVYFTDPRYPNDFLTASISQKFMERGDLKKVPDPREFPIGTSYVRVKVSKAKSVHHVYRFQEILSKLFTEYKTKVDEIIDIYQEFLPKFGQIPEVKAKDFKRTLKNLVPSQFISNYTRLCPNPPEIVFPEEKKEIIEKYPDRQIITFPKRESEGLQHEYICTDSKMKFPGLKRNNLKNKSQFKYLPCCYPKDQTKSSNYRNYYDEVDISKDDQIKNRRIIVTNKILEPDIFGVLPEYLNNLLVSIEPKFDFYRKGVTRTNNSFIECIAEAFDPEHSQFSRNDDRIPDFLEKIRKELVENTSIPIARQENYDLTISEIQDDILNMNQYFDPNKYYRLLENKYNCNIYLFNENGMVIPEHVENYLRYYKRYVHSIFIYEHLGSESDNAKYPQCEILTGIDPNIGITTQFYQLPYSNPFSIEIEKIFVKYNQSYLYNRLSKRIKIPLFEQVVSQSIDGCGKTRSLQFKMNDISVSLYTDPLPPLPVVEIPFEYKPVDFENARKIFIQLDIQIQHQTVVDEKCIEVSGFYEDVLYTCAVQPVNILENITIGYTRRIIPPVSSQLKNFNKKQKDAKHLSQLFLYTFSKYFQELNENVKNADNIHDDVFKNFVDNHIEKIENYSYDKFNKLVSQNNHAYSGDKLIVGGKNPHETLKRLMYFLRLNLERNRELVIKYYSKDYIFNFYDDVTDFIKRRGELIIPGKNALQKWIQEKMIDKKMYLNVNLNNKNPYFIKTSNKNLLNRQVYLCNNDINLQDSMSRQYYWNKMKYNLNDLSDIKHKYVNLEILKYKNMNNISLLKDGEDGKYKVLGYLQNGTTKYTTLLKV